jgi:hypothetical protein
LSYSQQLSQIKSEQATAKAAYEAGKISKTDYAKFMSYSHAQEQQLIASQLKTAKTEGNVTVTTSVAKKTKATGGAPLSSSMVEGNWVSTGKTTKASEQLAQQAKVYEKTGNLNVFNAPPSPDEEYELSDVQTYVTPPLPAQFPGETKFEDPKTPVKEVTEYTYTAKPVETPKGIGEQIAEFNPFEAGLSTAEFITGKKIKNKQVIVEKGTEILGSGTPGIKGTPTEFLGGAVSAVESPVYAIGSLVGVEGLPHPPTVSGAVVSSGLASILAFKLVSSPEMQALEQRSPAYQVGTVAGDILLSYVAGKAAEKIYSKVVPKTVQSKVASVKYSATQKVKQSKVGVAAAKAKSEVMYSKPANIARNLTSKVDTYFAKRTAKGAIEQSLDWNVVERPIVTGFKKAFPKDVVTTAGTYKTYPGFETWATVSEASKYAGYPKLRSLSTAAYASLRRSTELSIFEGGQVIPQQVPDAAKELQSWETFSGAAEVNRYTGYPVLQGRMEGVKLVKDPSAMDQIRKAIERGRYPAMGGLSSSQIPVYAKTVLPVTQTQRFPVDTGKKTGSTQPQQIFPVTGGKSKSLTVVVPFSGLIPKADTEPSTLLYEREKQKYTPLQPSTRKPTTPLTFVFPIPRTIQKEEQSVFTVPTAKTTPKLDVPQIVFPTPTVTPRQDTPTPSPTIPDFPNPPAPKIPEFPKRTPPTRFPGVPPFGGSGGGARGAGGFGVAKWYTRKNPVATLEQNLRVVTGMDKKTAGKWGKLLKPNLRLRAKPKRVSRRKKSKRKSKRRGKR